MEQPIPSITLKLVVALVSAHTQLAFTWTSHRLHDARHHQRCLRARALTDLDETAELAITFALALPPSAVLYANPWSMTSGRKVDTLCRSVGFKYKALAYSADGWCIEVDEVFTELNDRIFDASNVSVRSLH